MYCAEAVDLLTDDGYIVASVPNVQNGDVVWRLLRGRWDYRERGILDRGHLRFFTLDSIRGMFESRRVERDACRPLLSAVALA